MLDTTEETKTPAQLAREALDAALQDCTDNGVALHRLHAAIVAVRDLFAAVV